MRAGNINLQIPDFIMGGFEVGTHPEIGCFFEHLEADNSWSGIGMIDKKAAILGKAIVEQIKIFGHCPTDAGIDDFFNFDSFLFDIDFWGFIRTKKD